MPSHRAARRRQTTLARLRSLLTVAVLTAAGLVGGIAAAGSASALSCPLCVNFVTTYDPDGNAGPSAPVVKLHKNLVVNLPYDLDVNGSLPDVTPGVIPLPGYEVVVTVLAIDPNKPTVMINRLSTAPAVLPLRIELVQGDIADPLARKTAVGYDTLDSTVPTTFKVGVHLDDRDNNPATQNVLAAVTMTAAPRSLALFEEDFTGDPVGTRTDRHVRRLNFSGDGTTTKVPATVNLELTASDTGQHVVLTHDLRTRADIELSEPDGTKTTGTLNELPPSVDLTLADTDLDGDGTLDKQVDYVASATTADATLRLHTPSQTTDIAITDLPATMHLTDVATDARTTFTYHSSSRAAKAVITNTTSARTFSAEVVKPPANIDELSTTSTAGGGVFKLDSDARADTAKLTVTQDGKHAVATITGPPQDVTVDYGSQSGAGHVHYATSGELISHANLIADDELGQHVTVDVDQIPATLNVDYGKADTGSGDSATSDLTLNYHASSAIPHAELHASNLVGFIDRATKMDVGLDDIPTDFALSVNKQKVTTTLAPQPLPPPQRCVHEPHPEDDQYCPDYNGPGDQIILFKRVSNVTETNTVSATTPGPGRLGHGDVLITSGPDDQLAAANEIGTPIDGVLYEDTADRFVVSGRINQFDALTTRQSKTTQTTRVEQVSGPDDVTSREIANETAAGLDTNVPTHSLALKIWQQPRDGSEPVDQTLVNLATLPTHIDLDTFSQQIAGHDVTTWHASDVVNGYDTATVDGTHRPGFFLGNGTLDGSGNFTHKKTVSIDPMPTNFTACQASADDSCADGVFDANLAKGHAGPTGAEIQAACDQFGPVICSQPGGWFYRTWACLGSETCSNWNFPSQPGDANNGTVRLQADSPVSLFYGTNDYIHRNAPFTTLSFQNLTRFVLQGHHVTEIGGDCDGCEFGEVALDTDGHAITGGILQAEGETGAFLHFPEGFSASHLVWDFKKTGSLSGRLATLGALTCPSGTKIEVGGDDHTGQICDGDLT